MNLTCMSICAEGTVNRMCWFTCAIKDFETVQFELVE